MNTGIYIHIPFCKSRCSYCDFYSTTLLSQRERYVEAVCKELESRRPELGDEDIHTVYLGGGTPTLLRKGELERIFNVIRGFRQGIIAPQAEITIEANPDDLTTSYLQELRTLPFNRISIGIQTFHDKTLALINRRHTAAESVEAVQRCQQMGLDNISIDLIYGLPGETLEEWEYSLEQAIGLGVKHISAYHLTYEEGTKLWKMKEAGRVSPVEEDFSIKAFALLRERLLGAGYEHYEISNFSLPGWHSRHNSSYWYGVPYIGIGPGAHSYDGSKRRWNLSNLNAYIEGSRKGDFPYEEEVLSTDDRYNEYVITRLRTARGINLADIAKDFGVRYHRYCRSQASSYISRGQLLLSANEQLQLTPESIMISDAITRDLMI